MAAKKSKDASIIVQVEASCAFVKTVSGTHLHAEQSRVQAERLVAMFASRQVSSDRIPDVLAAVSGAGFLRADLKSLVDSLSSCPSAKPQSAESGDYQNFAIF